MHKLTYWKRFAFLSSLGVHGERSFLSAEPRRPGQEVRRMNSQEKDDVLVDDVLAVVFDIVVAHNDSSDGFTGALFPPSKAKSV